MMKRWWSYSHVVASSVAAPMAMGDANRARRDSRARFRVLVVPLMIVVFSVLAGSAGAERSPLEEASDAKKIMKTITGEIVTVSAHAISVEYSRTKTSAYEMLLPVDENVRLEHLKSIKELAPGDTVYVTYEQTYQDGEDGEPIILKSLAREIVLVKRSSGTSLSSEGSEEQGAAR